LRQDSLHLTVADTGWGKAVWGKLYGQWIVGATVFVYDHEKFTPADMLKMIEEHKITSFCAPPTIFRFMIREDLNKFDLSSLKYCTIAGEPLNPAVYEAFYNATGIKLMEGFGQTETTMTIGTFPWMEPKPGSMGVPNPAYDMDLITGDGRSAEDGEQGEIVLRTDRIKPLGLFKEYYRDVEKTKEVYSDNVYHTGDIAWRDEDGYYWFVGRTDDVIKSSGYRIGPFEVESALMTHPAVVECAITGVPDEVRGQVVKATIVLAKAYKDKAGEELVKEIQNHVKKTTAPYKYPRVVEFVEELPKTISGKIRRVEIRGEKK
jgi:acetyl-CoA synthetase